MKHRLSGIPLRKDSLFLREKHKFPALADGCEECMGIEIPPLLRRYTWTYSIRFGLECRVDWGLAGDFPSARRPTGLASRRHRAPPFCVNYAAVTESACR